jgi:predicted RNA-binding protein with PUA-like domain
MPAYWLMKSEPDECSIDDALAAPGQAVPWTGVRNYQARNFMWKQMQPEDGVLFYHSSCAEPGIYGIAQVTGAPYPDPTQFDVSSKYFDTQSKPDAPRWWLVDVRAVRKTIPLLLSTMRSDPQIEGLLVLQKGSRLSITPVSPAHWHYITTTLL